MSEICGDFLRPRVVPKREAVPASLRNEVLLDPLLVYRKERSQEMELIKAQRSQA